MVAMDTHRRLRGRKVRRSLYRITLLTFLFCAWTVLSWQLPHLDVAFNSDITHPIDKEAFSSPKKIRRQSIVQEYLMRTIQRPFLPLTAVLEASNVDFSRKPLPIRNQSTLISIPYPDHIKSCRDIPNHWPVNHPVELDSRYGPNQRSLKSLYPLRMEYANTSCPVDADPFLPWIHDVFTTSDGKFVEIIAHNKRRCRSDPNRYLEDIQQLEPQVALMQSVPVQRLTRSQVLDANFSHLPPHWKQQDHSYRLVPLQQADVASRETRFLCHFHTLRPTHNGTVEKVVLGETWSQYPYNYELANYRHRPGQSANPMLTRPKHAKDRGAIHNEQVWNAILHVRCPIPKATISIADNLDDIPSVYLDLVPIRTPPREDLTGYLPQLGNLSTFDPMLEWGTGHVLPPVNESGRWANIPVCPSPVQKSNEPISHISKKLATPAKAEQKHFLVGCLWASAVFAERGGSELDRHTQSRLLEWLTYHLDIAGFDHMYVYDNTEAFTNQTSLESVVRLFNTSQVTRIPWKHRVCNNNPTSSTNPGERSSQYAAEASCRIRYGPSTEWMIFFDTDEYLIPHGNWSSIRGWLRGGVQDGSIGADTHILSFYETRARLIYDMTEPYTDSSPECFDEESQCVSKRRNSTFLESYCEPFPFPRPATDTMTNMKQVYRPAFVLNHFVHYSTVSKLILDKPTHPRVVGRPYERRVNEISEAFMLHTKSTDPKKTRLWNSTCLGPRCPIGFPWPHYQRENTTAEEDIVIQYGYPYNCYRLKVIQDNLLSQLRRKVLSKLGSSQ
eukprot:Nitzschia sp. Nitz4//scaffold98_size77359//51989//54343//NITZ4_005552-RA/size77359-processed-gene-0.151-mRNA-1//-1//CDS//3329560769//2058//frame0